MSTQEKTMKFGGFGFGWQLAILSCGLVGQHMFDCNFVSSLCGYKSFTLPFNFPLLQVILIYSLPLQLQFLIQ